MPLAASTFSLLSFFFLLDAASNRLIFYLFFLSGRLENGISFVSRPSSAEEKKKIKDEMLMMHPRSGWALRRARHKIC
jgi:hypothetical protein